VLQWYIRVVIHYKRLYHFDMVIQEKLVRFQRLCWWLWCEKRVQLMGFTVVSNKTVVEARSKRGRFACIVTKETCARGTSARKVINGTKVRFAYKSGDALKGKQVEWKLRDPISVCDLNSKKWKLKVGADSKLCNASASFAFAL